MSMSIFAFTLFVSSVAFVHVACLTIWLPGDICGWKTLYFLHIALPVSDESHSLTISIESTSHHCTFFPLLLCFIRVESNSGRFSLCSAVLLQHQPTVFSSHNIPASASSTSQPAVISFHNIPAPASRTQCLWIIWCACADIMSWGNFCCFSKT